MDPHQIEHMTPSQRSIDMVQAEWLSIVMQGSRNEIYVMDGDTLHFLYVNETARMNLQYPANELAGLTPLDLAKDLAADAIEQALQPLRTGQAVQASLETVHVRKDGTRYPIELRLFHYSRQPVPAFIAIGNCIDSDPAKAINPDESRLHAIASNTPGLVYQFLQRHDGSVSFPYLSQGCHTLLGVTAHRLRSNPALFLNLIQPEDRQSYLDTMAASAADMKSWNWEGRIWIEKWKDIKWINLRSTPRVIPGVGVQWEGLMTNITQGKLAEFEIRRSRRQLAELSAHVEMVKEQERTRIAREIHDDLGGNLTAIKMALAQLTHRLPPGETLLAEKADYVDSLVDRTIEAAHRISLDLRPSILDLGIVAAIDWQAKEFETQLGIPCNVLSQEEEIDLPLDQATGLFRIFQEALTNIGKHAEASCVTVRLIQTEHDISLEIADNGRGMVATDRLKPKSFGLRGMTERAKALGGELTVGVAKEGGCLVTIRIPHSVLQQSTH
jgi:PAS domain S-box-containing protein